MSLPRAYLAMKLTQPLPIRGGPVLRTVGEAANYVLELPQRQVEGCQRWRQAAQLLLDQAGVAEVSKQVCGGWMNCRDLGQVFEHEGPLSHPAQDQPQ